MNHISSPEFYGFYKTFMTTISHIMRTQSSAPPRRWGSRGTIARSDLPRVSLVASPGLGPGVFPQHCDVPHVPSETSSSCLADANRSKPRGPEGEWIRTALAFLSLISLLKTGAIPLRHKNNFKKRREERKEAGGKNGVRKTRREGRRK